MEAIKTPFTQMVGVDYPIICGAMYPCSNPELVAAVSEAGGLGVIQPMTLTYVNKYDLREGIRFIRSKTKKPIGFNAIVEKSVKSYEDRMRRWIEIALEEGVKLFVTALGNPDWVVQLAEQAGAFVYHDVTERKWAHKALDAGVHGLICVNRQAGGHAGQKAPDELYQELKDLGVPLICAGGIGSPTGLREALDLGYAGVQMGTRFIAAEECSAHRDYKQAILDAKAEDIVLTEKLSGVPCAIIKTPSVEKIGLKAGPLAKLMLKGHRTKKFMRSYYALTSMWRLKRASLEGMSYKDYFAAGKSVATIESVEPAATIVQNFARECVPSTT